MNPFDGRDLGNPNDDHHDDDGDDHDDDGDDHDDVGDDHDTDEDGQLAKASKRDQN